MRKIAVIGLGYVGLPVAVAFARRFPGTLGYDLDLEKVERLQQGRDLTGEVDSETLEQVELKLTAVPQDLSQADFYVVAVPTPIDRNHRPDLRALRSSSRTVGTVLSPGDIVVFESTVYPGVTEEVCGPILEEVSGLRCGVDFKLGYSPERINPGDREHTFERITKVVSGQDADTLEIVAETYGAVVEAGVHRASSIKVAEAAKVIENTQRDLNIALMNELALIFDRLEVDTQEVLRAAGTKWNFLRFSPGLVGGHCIGVDPYYLTTKAEELGIHPQVILAGRRINDGMGSFVAEKTIKQLILANRNIQGARVVVLGLSFKENVPDVRNSRVPDIVRELQEYGVEVLVHDPVVHARDAMHEYGIELRSRADLDHPDAVILAVPHEQLGELPQQLCRSDPAPAVFVDVRGRYSEADFDATIRYWRL